MKLTKTILTLFALYTGLSSCTMQKRVYNNGYNFSWKTKKYTPSTNKFLIDKDILSTTKDNEAPVNTVIEDDYVNASNEVKPIKSTSTNKIQLRVLKKVEQLQQRLKIDEPVKKVYDTDKENIRAKKGYRRMLLSIPALLLVFISSIPLGISGADPFWSAIVFIFMLLFLFLIISAFVLGLKTYSNYRKSKDEGVKTKKAILAMIPVLFLLLTLAIGILIGLVFLIMALI